MQVRISTDAPASLATGALVLPVFSDQQLDGAARDIDALLGGALRDVLDAGEITGKPNEIALVHAKDAPFRRVALIGLGDRAKFKLSGLQAFAGTAVRALGKRKIAALAFVLPAEAAANVRLAASALVEGALAGALDGTVYQTDPEKPVKADDVTILAGAFDPAALEAGVARGRIVGEAINIARLMAFAPANDMTPTDMANRARELGAQAGLEVDVLDEAQMKAKGMGSLLGVAQGSAQPATLSVMTYRGNPESSEILALVGKGVTFDSGGISIKPAGKMHEMKYDMSGGGAVIAALYAIGKLRPKINVIGLVPATENLPGPDAVKPGDILKAMNGKTIEVINTDAEGRLILADALCYARELGATKIVDAATLTGAVVVALGDAASAVMSNDDAFVAEFLRVVADSGERYWQLPLYDDYDRKMKSEIADLRNQGEGGAGSETAGAFLKAFVGDVPWLHLDVAGTAYADGESAYLAKGPTGTPVRAFIALVEALAAGAAAGAATTNGERSAIHP